ncbi:MAG: hypothetical protein E7519_09045 [Ruminococcaceae bacterium]|nr:hypothetical protein [Oscillospiraceae bacterium]
MLSLSELQSLSQTETGQLQLTDIQNVKIDAAKPAVERMENLLSQIKNPYRFLCGGVAVKISFSENGKPLSEKLAEHFIRQKGK